MALIQIFQSIILFIYSFSNPKGYGLAPASESPQPEAQSLPSFVPEEPSSLPSVAEEGLPEVESNEPDSSLPAVEDSNALPEVESNESESTLPIVEQDDGVVPPVSSDASLPEPDDNSMSLVPANLPSFNSSSTIPEIPELPEISEVPAISAVPAIPDVPVIPNVPDVLGLPEPTSSSQDMFQPLPDNGFAPPPMLPDADSNEFCILFYFTLILV